MAASRRRIALVNVFFPPRAVGGATRVLADNIDSLRAAHDAEFDLVGFTTEPEHVAALDAARAAGGPARLRCYGWQGMRVYQADAWWRPNMDWHPQDPAMEAAFERFLDHERPDLVHFHCVQRIGIGALDATRRRGIPFVVTIHDAWWISDFQFLVDARGTVYPDGHPDPFAETALPEGISREQSIARRALLKNRLRGAAALLTVSESFRELHARNGLPGLQVTPNGVSDSCAWRPKSTAHTPRVVCALIGGLADHKGFPLFRAAVHASRPRNIEVLLVDHARPPGWERRTQWGEVPVRIIGRVPQEAVVDLYAGIDVLFAPSIWPESFGLVTREAAACGCWIVASNRGGIGEDVVPGNGWVVEPALAALRGVIDAIDAEPARCKRPAQAPPVRRASAQAAELAGLYRRILEANVPPR